MDEISTHRLVVLAKDGDRHAQHELGMRLRRGDDEEPDVPAARHWLTLAAEAGHVLAQLQLSRLLRNEVSEYDPCESTNWCSAAASVGLREAQFMLGVHLSEGFGCDRDHAAALMWWHRAAAQGEAAALFNLWVVYGQGKLVPKDPPRARRYLQKALVTDPRVFRFIRWNNWRSIGKILGAVLVVSAIVLLLWHVTQ